jgi:tryptophan-rich sensory protein
MMKTPSKNQVLMARVVVILLIAFLGIGAITYGFSAEVRERVWHDLLQRPDRTMRFRFILQPVMAAIAALRDGVEDAKLGRPPYFWTLLTKTSDRVGRLEEGVISTARILLLGLGMDTVYQLIVLKAFYPAEAVIVAVVLAFFPYLILRGPIARIARWRLDATSADESR